MRREPALSDGMWARVEPLLPPLKGRGSRGGRPVSYGAQDYKQGNVVERAFNRIKQWRGIATRYDKHALVYRGAVVLASILLWLR